MAEKLIRMSIAMKAAMFVAFMFLACSGFIITMNLFADQRASLEDTRIRATELARSAAALAREQIAANQVDVLSRFLEEMENQPGVVQAYALAADGRVMADGTPSDEAGSATRADRVAVRAWAENTELTVVEGDHVHVALPINHNGEFAGVLRMTMSLAVYHERARRDLWRNILLNLLGIGIALPLTGLAITRVMRPVRKLTEASELVAARNLDARLDVRTGDELEVLATAFNEMLDQLKASMDRVRRLAFVDELTRLPNKTAFTEHVRRLIKDASTPGALLLIDLDRFKRFNDTFGEREGDRILTQASERLRGVVARLRTRFDHPDAKAPVLARLMGDEFAILISGPAATGAAKQTAQEIVAALSAPMEIAGQEIALTTSVGIARFPLDTAHADHLLRHANLAIDAAKAEGGGVFKFFEPEMTRRAVERVTLENELRRAVAEREFEVHYQPKVDARTGRTTGCEALVRWRRRGRIVGPFEFIQTAEECGLILEIGDFVLRESCKAAARWRAEGLDCNIAVNVSALQFESENFGEAVMNALEAASLPAASLELELTESVAMDDIDRVIAQVEPLRSNGVRFAIDDFGTGYSSLGSLTRLPFDVFKIDQSFVRRMEQDPNARVVIETILAMARALGYQTVAEGVETEAHFAFLRLNGCTYAQGWHFGRPMPEAKFLDRLRSERDAYRAEAAHQDETPRIGKAS